MTSLRRPNKKLKTIIFAMASLHLMGLVWKFEPNKFAVKLNQPPTIHLKLVKNHLDQHLVKNKKQIVQSEESKIQEKKDQSFLSDKNRSFDRQTVSKKIDVFKKMALGNAVTSSLSKQKKDAKNPNKIKNIKLSDIGISSRNPASLQRRGSLNGDMAEFGVSATNDYVEEVKLGDFTHLNTVEYKYYGFFFRIRQKLEQFWGKSIHEKSQALFRSGRSIASQDYVTSLQVTLNVKGEIIRVKILGASGVKELDDAAVESFNNAGPFPNPPKDLLVNGMATIEWGFVVKS